MSFRELDEDEDVAFEEQLPDYNCKLWKGLYSQWRARKFCDLKVVTTNGIVPMHACVWSAFSAGMANLVEEELADEKSKHKLSVSLAVSSEVVFHIAHVLYTGTFRPPKSLLAQLYSTASYLGFSDLLDMIDQYCQCKSVDFFGEIGLGRKRKHDNTVEEFDDHIQYTDQCQQSAKPPREQSYRVYVKGKKIRTQLNRIKQPSHGPNIELYQWSNMFNIELFVPRYRLSSVSNMNSNILTGHRSGNSCPVENAENEASNGIDREDEIKKEVGSDLEPKVFVCNMPQSETFRYLDSWSKTRVNVNRLNLKTNSPTQAPKSASLRKTRLKLSPGRIINRSVSTKPRGSNSSNCNSGSSVQEQFSKVVNNAVTGHMVVTSQCSNVSKSKEKVSGSKNTHCKPTFDSEPAAKNQRKSSGFSFQTACSGNQPNLSQTSNFSHPASDCPTVQSIQNPEMNITSTSMSKSIQTTGVLPTSTRSVPITSTAQAPHSHIDHSVIAAPTLYAVESNTEDLDEDCFITLCHMGLQNEHSYSQTPDPELRADLCSTPSSVPKSKQISDNEDNDSITAAMSGSSVVQGAQVTKQLRREVDSISGHSRLDIGIEIKQEADPDILQSNLQVKNHSRTNTSVDRTKMIHKSISNQKTASQAKIAQTKARVEPNYKESDTSRQISCTNIEKLRSKAKTSKDHQLVPVSGARKQPGVTVFGPTTSNLNCFAKEYSLTVNGTENTELIGCDMSQPDLHTNDTSQNNDDDRRLQLPSEFAEMTSVLPVEQDGENGAHQGLNIELSKLSVEKEVEHTPSCSSPAPCLKSNFALKNCYVSLKRLTSFEKQSNISSRTIISTKSLGLETSSSNVFSQRALPPPGKNHKPNAEKMQKNNIASGLKQISKAECYIPRKEEQRGLLKKSVNESNKDRQQRSSEKCDQTLFAFHSTGKSKTKVRAAPSNECSASLVSSEIITVDHLGNPDEYSRPKRQRMLSTRLAGCKLFGDLNLLQGSDENDKFKKRPKTTAHSPSPSSSLPLSPYKDKDADDDGDGSSSWRQSSSEPDDQEEVEDNGVDPVLSPQNSSPLSVHSTSRGLVENGRDGNKDADVDQSLISDIFTSSLFEECDTHAMTLSILEVEATSEFKCVECCKVFEKKNSLSKHLYKFHGTCPISLKCSYCGHYAKTSMELLQHSSQLHNDTMPFKCPHKGCCFSSAKRYAVVNHLLTHSSERKVKCHKCGRCFKTANYLKVHLTACNNLKKYICEVCGKRFNIKASLRQHVNTIHGEAKEYLCTYCGKRFTCNNNLKRHLRIHKNSFPYPCKFCKAKFRHSNTLKGHVEKKHKICNFTPQRVL